MFNNNNKIARKSDNRKKAQTLRTTKNARNIKQKYTNSTHK